MTRLVLLNPGPVTLSERVRRALLQPDLCHREPEFTELQNRIRGLLLDLYGLPPGDWAAILLAGSGSAAIEAMLSSLVPTHAKLLILENGVYGERLSAIAKVHALDHSCLSHEWGAPLDLQRLEVALRADPAISHIALVHHETTTGRLNDLDKIASICQRLGVDILLDGVSSFAAEAINFTEWPLLACAATANKCIQGVPGVSFVLVKRGSFKGPSTARTLYLDLGAHLASQDGGSTLFTPPVQACYALAAALEELQEAGGWMARRRLYCQRMQAVRDGLQGLGIKPFIERGQCASALNAFYLPAGCTYQRLHAALKEAGFIIYAGQGRLTYSLFRIACMGEILPEDITRFIAAMKDCLTQA